MGIKGRAPTPTLIKATSAIVHPIFFRTFFDDRQPSLKLVWGRAGKPGSVLLRTLRFGALSSEALAKDDDHLSGIDIAGYLGAAYSGS